MHGAALDGMEFRQTASPICAVSTIDSISVRPDRLEVLFHGRGNPVSFSWFWLRDHCRDEVCTHPHTGQRQLDTAAIPPGIRPRGARIDDDGESVEVDWGDHRSRYTARFLAALACPADTEPVPIPWDGRQWRNPGQSSRSPGSLGRTLANCAGYSICWPNTASVS